MDEKKSLGSFYQLSLPEDSVEHHVRLLDQKGQVVFEKEHVRAPGGWSALAVQIAAQKYFVKRNVPGTASGGEEDVSVMLRGVARTIADSGFTQGYFATREEAERFEECLYRRQRAQHGAFNSPVYFNVRHYRCYGIEGGSGNFAWDETKNEPIVCEGNYTRPQSSACFIIGVRDSLCGAQGVTETLATEARIFKYGSGAGANFSALREKNAPLNVGGVSSGLISFLEVLDRQAGAIKSAGTTRRAAKMVILDDDHPDLREFIQWKVNEERKAQALIAAGYSDDLNGEAYQSVAGQNANNSIRVTDRFMEAVIHDEVWELRSRVPSVGVTARYPAKQLFREMMEAAWSCGDPGLQFHDTINTWHTTPADGAIEGSNPCSEYLSINDSACNLASLRLTKFLNDANDHVNLPDLRDAVRLFFLAQEILVDLASYPTATICANAHKHRQLGLGYCDLSALLLRLGYGYDTEEGRSLAGAITAYVTGCAYEMSVDSAERMGPAEAYTRNKESVLCVLEQHAEQVNKRCEGDKSLSSRYIWRAADAVWSRVLTRATQYGVRNMQATLLAPTGTISFLMDATTTGIEPLLALVQTKYLVGGGQVQIENSDLSLVLEKLGYSVPDRAAICDWVRDNGEIRTAPGFRSEHAPLFETALGAYPLRPEAHVLMLAAVQPFLSGAISKTVNLPNTATVEDFERLAMLAWARGVKCLALYRDGSKGVQPVKAKGAEAPPEAPTEVPTEAPSKLAPLVFRGTQEKLPNRRPGWTWGVTLAGHKIYIRSGEYPDGRLGEVFVDIAQEGSTLGGLMCTWARGLSIGLQYGVPLEEYVKSHLHTRYEPHGMVGKHDTIKLADSLTDLVIRVLAVHYLGRTDLQQVQIESMAEVPGPSASAAVAPASVAASTKPDGTGPACPSCGAITVRNGSCHRCPRCGDSLGCS